MKNIGKIFLALSLIPLVVGCSTINHDAGSVSSIGSVSSNLNAPDGQCAFDLRQTPAFINPPKEKWQCNWLGCQGWYNLIYSDTPEFRAKDILLRSGESGQIEANFYFNNIFFTPLDRQKVYAYIFGTNIPAWTLLATAQTNSKGELTIPTTLARGQYRIRLVIAGNLAYNELTITVTGAAQKALVFDIDGTLTISDFDSAIYTVQEWLNLPLGAGAAYPMGPELTKLYHDLGYLTVCLTGRPKELTTITRDWLAAKGAVCDYLRLTQTNAEANSVEEYKFANLTDLRSRGLDFIAAYGNATTDISAYARAGITKAVTYIIGENAGKEDTQPLKDSYASRYQAVQSTQTNLCN